MHFHRNSTYSFLIVTALCIILLNLNYFLGNSGMGYLGISIAIALIIVLMQQTIIYHTGNIRSFSLISFFVLLCQFAILWTYFYKYSKFLVLASLILQGIIFIQACLLLKSAHKGKQ